tara:strand:+ start:6643 stop:6750 length:108 start_codon:yes stop_codon:yes gene_type:complete
MNLATRTAIKRGYEELTLNGREDGEASIYSEGMIK